MVTSFLVSYLLFLWPDSPSGPGIPYCWGFEITLRHSTLGRHPLEEWSVRHRDLYLTTHTIHKDVHTPSGIRARNPRKWVAADPRLSPSGQRDRSIILLHHTQNKPIYMDCYGHSTPCQWWHGSYVRSSVICITDTSRCKNSILKLSYLTHRKIFSKKVDKKNVDLFKYSRPKIWTLSFLAQAIQIPKIVSWWNCLCLQL